MYIAVWEREFMFCHYYCFTRKESTCCQVLKKKTRISERSSNQFEQIIVKYKRKDYRCVMPPKATGC